VALLTRPTLHRLMIVLSLLLALTVAMPEVASGKHKRPKRRMSTAGFTASFIPPTSFNCTWVEEPLHDYRCTASPGGWPDPFPLRVALSRNGNPPPPAPPGQEWKGLASPEVAPVFSCEPDESGDLSAAHYRCTFDDPQEHTFMADQIVSVCDDERVTPEGVSFCSPDYVPGYTGGGALIYTPVQGYDPPQIPPPPRGPDEDFFELDSWYPPDSMPPDTTITAGPSGLVASREASLRFGSTENGSTFECRLDGSQWEKCEAPRGYEQLQDGAHSVQVRATDGASNLDPTPAGRTWQIDATPPDARILQGPRNITRDRTPSFIFVASELTATLQCSLDAASFTGCTSPHTVMRPLSDGTHSFVVQASDFLGNVDQTPARRAVTVDTSGPRMKISGRRVRLTRRGVARVRIRCPASELTGLCAGKLTLKTAKRVEVGARPRIVTLGKKRVRVTRGRAVFATVKLSRQGRRVVAKLENIRVRATIRARDRVGNVATTRRSFVLEAPGR
jgi:hypothetical protein